MKPVLSTGHLDVGYDNKLVVSDINIQAMKGQVIGLLGPNGAGKTTILRSLSGLLAPVNGVVELDGKDLSKEKKKELARKLSIVLTEQLAPSMLTVFGIVSMGRTPYSDFLGRLSKEDRDIITDALKMVDAVALQDRFFSELSDGEKQKVMIARALVQEPELIILDEPTSHLDIKYKIEVIRVLQKLAREKGITCILSLHDIDLALKGCQRVLLVHNGKIVAQGMPEEVVQGGMIQKLYDIKGAAYNELLGLVELHGANKNDIFVTGGNSSGIHLYRVLARMGYGITTGVLHENDLDFKIAEIVCSNVISERPFEKISEENYQKAHDLMMKASIMIDSGFPVGEGNEANIILLQKGLEQHKKMYSLREPMESEGYFGEMAENIMYVKDIAQLTERIKTKERI